MSSDKMDVETIDDTQHEDEVTYGNCEGPDSEYIKLISSDGHEFIIKRETAIIAETIKAMLDGPIRYAENETNVIHLKDIPSNVLQQICCFLCYKKYYDCTTRIPEFKISAPIVLDLLMAANFLDC